MKIKYALVGSNKNPDFLDFWPIISKVWKTRFDVIPVLGLITEEESEIISTNDGLVIKIKKSNLLSEIQQSQLVRLFLPKFLDGVCIVSDIDMIPISKKYFIDNISQYEDKDFLILSSHHEQTLGTNQYPMCYVVGHSKVFHEIFDLNESWDQFLSSVPNFGWFSDQVFLYNKVKNSNYTHVKFPYREFGANIKRIDRSDWNYNTELLQSDYYIDSHLLRPYKPNEIEINKLINLL